MNNPLDEFELWKFLAGLGMFLFGMFIMEESIKILSGKAFKRMIREYTTGRFKSILAGTISTAILQSSSAVSLMVLAFVGAGIINMQNGIGVILGSNIGTTLTAWIVAIFGFQIKIESFAQPLIGIGGLLIIFFGQSERLSGLSKLLVGFGFLFLGLDYMKTSVDSLAKTIDISVIPDYGHFFYIFLGIVITSLMQSSSATIAIILTALSSGIINFYAAAGMVIGSNIGTTTTIILGSVGGSQAKKRVAFSHFLFNMITGIFAYLTLDILVFSIEYLIDVRANGVTGIALFHTIFNIVGVLIFLPFINLFAVMLVRLFPDRKTELTFFINKMEPEFPDAAITALKNEVLHLVNEVIRYNLRLFNITDNGVFPEKKNRTIMLPETYRNIKLLQAEIITFASKVQTEELTENESAELAKIFYASKMTMYSAKTVKDIKHDLEDFESADNPFLIEQFTFFQQQLREIYTELDNIINSQASDEKPVAILKLLKKIHENDINFVSLIISIANAKKLKNIHISNLLLVNRSFTQSSNQLILAVKEIILDNKELEFFEKVQDLKETIS